ncbi:hypothetical protein CHE29_18380 [Salmonella enterica]|nr:hypothetical protein CHE29_18380 [Salmonella enterica]
MTCIVLFISFFFGRLLHSFYRRSQHHQDKRSNSQRFRSTRRIALTSRYPLK